VSYSSLGATPKGLYDLCAVDRDCASGICCDMGYRKACMPSASVCVNQRNVAQCYLTYCGSYNEATQVCDSDPGIVFQKQFCEARGMQWDCAMKICGEKVPGTPSWNPPWPATPDSPVAVDCPMGKRWSSDAGKCVDMWPAGPPLNPDPPPPAKPTTPAKTDGSWPMWVKVGLVSVGGAAAFAFLFGAYR
jgi:hypothetical protein